MDDENIEKIKVFSSEDKKLKIIGELLSNDSSRKIIRCLIDNEMYINELSKKLDLRVSLVIHHLKKLEDLGLLEITEKQIVKKGNMHKFYKMIPNFFISPNADKKKVEEKGFFKKIFKESVKFSVIGLVGIFSWIILKPKKTIDDKNDSDIIIGPDIIVEYTNFVDVPANNDAVILSILIPILAISMGLNIERILKKFWNKGKKRG